MKLSAAKQALSNGNCTLGTIRKPKKRKRSKTVRGQSAAPGTAIADTAAIDISVGKPKPKKK